VNLVSVYEKLERIVKKLPNSLQHPILREIMPIKTMFLQQRAPRVVLLGDRAASRTSLANALFSAPVACSEEDHLQDGTWQTFEHGHGKMRILDARTPASLALLTRAIESERPDVFLFLHVEPRSSEEVAADFERVSQIITALPPVEGSPTPHIIGVSVSCTGECEPETVRRQLREALTDRARNPFADKVTGVFVLHSGAGEAHALAKAIALELPPEAKLEMGRLSGVREVQRELAQVVIKSITAICAAIGAQPIPLADLPVLTSLQAAMVAGIMHISGRDLSLKLAGQWITALGANIGLALALREGARATLKFVPVWGDIISGGIAAAGTYAMGRAAAAYFIEGMTLQDAQRLFKKTKKNQNPPLLRS